MKPCTLLLWHKEAVQPAVLRTEPSSAAGVGTSLGRPVRSSPAAHRGGRLNLQTYMRHCLEARPEDSESTVAGDHERQGGRVHKHVSAAQTWEGQGAAALRAEWGCVLYEGGRPGLSCPPAWLSRRAQCGLGGVHPPTEVCPYNFLLFAQDGSDEQWLCLNNRSVNKMLSIMSSVSSTRVNKIVIF